MPLSLLKDSMAFLLCKYENEKIHIGVKSKGKKKLRE